ncbi:MAG: shikimate dehydrogenase, partial [Candidatus Dormibacteria bacterium]
ARADLVVNATPVGLDDGDPVDGAGLAGKVVLDLAYRPGGTNLFKRAWREGALAVQGQDMLLHQGAAAFELWTGTSAPLRAMREALDAALLTD